MLTIEEFLEKLGKKEPNYIEKCEKNKIIVSNKMLLPNYAVDCLISCIGRLQKDGKNEDVEKRIYDIIKEPSLENGIVYETLVYDWLYKHYIPFELQPHIEQDDCFKTSLNGYDADGKIENVIFDVKTFSFGMPRYQELSSKLNSLIKEKYKEKVTKGISDKNLASEICYGNYYITVSGNANLSSDMFEKKYLGKEKEVFNSLFDEKNKIFTDYLLKDSEFYIEIRAHYREFIKPNEDDEKKKYNFYYSLSEFDSTEWAMNNQYQLLRHGSQFCRTFPYMIICPYDNYKCNKLFGDNDKYLTFRYLCRRMFMYHTKIENRCLQDFDGKAQNKVSVATAAKKLSAVLFLDVSQKKEKSEGYLYVNPNADNLLRRYFYDLNFRSNGICIDDFKYDNY